MKIILIKFFNIPQFFNLIFSIVIFEIINFFCKFKFEINFPHFNSFLNFFFANSNFNPAFLIFSLKICVLSRFKFDILFVAYIPQWASVSTFFLSKIHSLSLIMWHFYSTITFVQSITGSQFFSLQNFPFCMFFSV